MADEQTLEPQTTEEPKAQAPVVGVKEPAEKEPAAKEPEVEVPEAKAPEVKAPEAAAPEIPAEAPKPDASLAGQLKAALGITAPDKPEQVRPEAVKSEAVKSESPRSESAPARSGQPRRDQQSRPPRENRPQGAAGPRPAGGGPPNRDRGENRGERTGEHRGEHRGGDRGDKRPGGFDRPRFDVPEIELEKLIADSLYLDNQAHAIVIRMRDMDTGTKSQLRRLYNSVRRAVRAPEAERQHEFVMLRARLAYTIARHSLRSLDQIEKLLLQVTRKNENRGYERFKDLFEAIVAYNE